MYKYLIDSAGNGLNGLALLALLTFFAILCIAFAAAFLRKRSFIDHMAALPLDLDVEPLHPEVNSADHE